MRTAYGVTCLVLGAALILAQLVASWQSRHRTSRTEVVQAAEMAGSAAELARDAARATRTAATPPLGQEGLGDHVRALVERMQTAAAQAESKATEAKDKAEQAKATAGAGVGDVLTALAGRTPLALAGGAIIALGAQIMGYLDLSASASTG